jgi:hypothetical protein
MACQGTIAGMKSKEIAVGEVYVWDLGRAW